MQVIINVEQILECEVGQVVNQLARIIFKYSCEDGIVHVLYRGRSSLGNILTLVYNTATQLLLCYLIDLHLMLAIIFFLIGTIISTQIFGFYKLLHLESYYISSVGLVTPHSEVIIYFLLFVFIRIK